MGTGGASPAPSESSAGGSAEASGAARAKKLIEDGRYAEAEALLRELLAAFGEADSVGTADLLDLLVDAMREGGKAGEPETLETARRAARIRESLLGEDHPDFAGSLNNEAILLAIRGDLSESEALFRRAADIRERALGPDHPEVSESLNGLGKVLQMAGDYPAAQQALERTARIREKALGPDHPALASALYNLGNLRRVTGDYTGARADLERALRIDEAARGVEHPTLAYGLNSLAIVAGETGDFATARALFERSLELRRKALGEEHPLVAESLNNLGVWYSETGDPARARPFFERAVELRTRELGPDNPVLVQEGLDNLAATMARLGEPATAEAMYRRSLQILERGLGPDHPGISETLIHLAELLGETGREREALPLYERALHLREQGLGPRHPHVAACLERFAEALARVGDRDRALEAALRAEEIRRDHRSLTSRTLSERQALRYAARRGSSLDEALSLAASGVPPEAERKVWDAVIRSRARVLDEMAARNRSIAGTSDPAVRAAIARLATARAHLAHLVVRALEGEDSGSDPSLLEKAFHEKEDAERSLAERSLSFRREDARSRAGWEEVRASLPADTALVAYARYRPLSAAVSAPAPTAATPPDQARPDSSLPAPAPSTPEPPAQASSAAAPSGDYYIALVLPPGSSDPVFVPLGAASAIDALVGAWEAEASSNPVGTRPAIRRAEARYREAGAKLRRAFWDPVAAAFGGASRVFVVPDGTLNLVSVPSLPSGQDSYLIETAPILHVLSTERDLVSPDVPDPQTDRLLVLGGPTYDTLPAGAKGAPAATVSAARTGAPPSSGQVFRGSRSGCDTFRSRQFAPLPGTRQEAVEVASLWGRKGSASKGNGSGGDTPALRLLGPDASESHLKEQAPGSGILHLATHAFFLGDCPSGLEGASDSPAGKVGENPLLLSGLALAGANRRDQAAEGQDDGILTAEEIASLDLSRVEWAVLSSCRTGVGTLQAGEGVLGLRRAFRVAGARAIIMSLWRVDDQATRRWMRQLYRARLSGLGTAESVRRASLDLLREGRAAGKGGHPFTWGAFVAAGDWR